MHMTSALPVYDFNAKFFWHKVMSVSWQSRSISQTLILPFPIPLHLPNLYKHLIFKSLSMIIKYIHFNKYSFTFSIFKMCAREVSGLQ